MLTMGGGICWGLSGSVGQYMFEQLGMDARWLVPIRLFFAGLILFIYCFFTCRDKLFGIWKTPRTAALLLAYGITGVTLCQYAYFRTIQLSSAGIATILQDFAPAMILICTCVLARRLPRAGEILSILLAFAGIYLIMTHGNLHALSISTHAFLVGLFSAATVVVYNMLTDPLARDFPVTVMQAWSFLLGGILLEVVFHSWTYEYVPSVRGLLGIAFVVLVGNVAAFTMYVTGVRYIGPNKGILYGFAEPVTAALISTLVLGSAFTIWDAAGFACIFLMLVLISLSGGQKAQS